MKLFFHPEISESLTTARHNFARKCTSFEVYWSFFFSYLSSMRRIKAFQKASSFVSITFPISSVSFSFFAFISETSFAVVSIFILLNSVFLSTEYHTDPSVIVVETQNIILTVREFSPNDILLESILRWYTKDK